MYASITADLGEEIDDIEEDGKEEWRRTIARPGTANTKEARARGKVDFGAITQETQPRVYRENHRGCAESMQLASGQQRRPAIIPYRTHSGGRMVSRLG